LFCSLVVYVVRQMKLEVIDVVIMLCDGALQVVVVMLYSTCTYLYLLY